MKNINHTPLRDALQAAGKTEVEGRYLYQDYLNQVAGSGMSRDTVPPMSEEQWEVMCDIVRRDQPMYASTVKSMLSNMKAKAERESTK